MLGTCSNILHLERGAMPSHDEFRLVGSVAPNDLTIGAGELLCIGIETWADLHDATAMMRLKRRPIWNELVVTPEGLRTVLPCLPSFRTLLTDGGWRLLGFDECIRRGLPLYA